MHGLFIKMKSVVLVCFLLESTAIVAGIKILGGFFENHNDRSTDHHGNRLQWGDTDSSAEDGTRTLTFATCYCKNTFSGLRGFCYQKLIVSTREIPNEAHFQILGSYQVIYDMEGSAIYETVNRVGVQTARPPMEDIIVADGEVWNSVTNQWGYGNLHFIVNATTRPPLVDTLSSQVHSSDNRDLTLPEQGTENLLPGTKREKRAEFRTWVAIWRQGSIKYLFTWSLDSTDMVDVSVDHENAELISYREIPRKSITFENQDSAIVTSKFPQLSSSDFSVSSSVHLSSVFDFDFNVSRPMGVYITSKDPSLATSLFFEFSSAQELYETHIERDATSVQWPDSCPSGTRITYKVSAIEETQRMPMRFAFRRGIEEWVEALYAVATMRVLKVSSASCCSLQQHTIGNPCKFVPACGVSP